MRTDSPYCYDPRHDPSRTAAGGRSRLAAARVRAEHTRAQAARIREEAERARWELDPAGRPALPGPGQPASPE